MSNEQVTQSQELEQNNNEQSRGFDALAALSSMFDDEGNLLEDPKKSGEQPEKTEDNKEPEEKKDSEEDKKSEDEVNEPKHKVKVNGQEFEVELSELIKGYQREADYTRKTMRLAEERNTVDKTRDELAQVRAQASQERDIVAKAINEVLMTASALDPILAQESQIDWTRLAQENPGEYIARRAEIDQKKTQLNNLYNHLNTLEQQRQEDFQKQRQAKFQDEYSKLQEVLPEIKDKGKAEELKNEMASFLREVGFTDQELENVYDHRMFVVIKKALLYDKAMKQRTTGKAEAPVQPLQKGSAAVSEKEQLSDKAKKSIGQFRKSGNMRDGADALIALGIV